MQILNNSNQSNTNIDDSVSLLICVQVLSGHEGPVASITFSPTDAVLASASWDKTLKIWDIFQSKGSRETLKLTTDGEYPII